VQKINFKYFKLSGIKEYNKNRPSGKVAVIKGIEYLVEVLN
tara:strand:- start:171 stop:293 length:123 start_codon:yes stop_codon:yes gene_type:complete